MLHTLRELIGDKAFFDVTRLAVYGRADPKPGNFTPRFGSTKEYEGLVRKVTGKDYAWFFDVYLRQAALPDLIQTRTADTLSLAWKVPGNGAFPLPVQVQVDGKTRTLPMTGGKARIAVPATAHVVIDPGALVLRREVAIEDVATWKAAQAAKPKPQ
jgi:aminopeptidase N